MKRDKEEMDEEDMQEVLELSMQRKREESRERAATAAGEMLLATLSEPTPSEPAKIPLGHELLMLIANGPPSRPDTPPTLARQTLLSHSREISRNTTPVGSRPSTGDREAKTLRDKMALAQKKDAELAKKQSALMAFPVWKRDELARKEAAAEKAMRRRETPVQKKARAEEEARKKKFDQARSTSIERQARADLIFRPTLL